LSAAVAMQLEPSREIVLWIALALIAWSLFR
jgi:hypothetical protein